MGSIMRSQNIMGLDYGSNISADAKLFGAHQRIWRLQVNENTVIFALKLYHVSCNIFRFDIMGTHLHELHCFIITHTPITP